MSRYQIKVIDLMPGYDKKSGHVVNIKFTLRGPDGSTTQVAPFRSRRPPTDEELMSTVNEYVKNLEVKRVCEQSLESRKRATNKKEWVVEVLHDPEMTAFEATTVNVTKEE